MTEFSYQNPFPLGNDNTSYRLIKGSGQFVSTHDLNEGFTLLKIHPDGLRQLAAMAMHDVSFFLRKEHNQQVARILEDPESSKNDQAVALAMLENAEIASQEILPICQDTGTAIVMAKKGQQVWTGCDDCEQLSAGIFDTYNNDNLRYSQTAPLTMFEETNTGDNLPAQIDLYATTGDEYNFLFIAKGGGSANKSFLFQETKAVLNPVALKEFLTSKMKTLGTAACPPYHIAFVIGGTSAEANLKTVKLASTKYLDSLPVSGNSRGRAFRDISLEAELLEEAYKLGIGAQFGGKYFAHDIRVIRLPRHGASCPIGMGVSCSADRNIRAKINAKGLWLEELDFTPGVHIPGHLRTQKDTGAIAINLNNPMEEILAQLDRHPVSTRVLLSGEIIVGRDIAHAKWKKLLDSGKPLPDYLKNHPVYYAGPAKTPPGKPSGSFGPTTAGRMDSYVDLFQQHGGSMVMLAKGNRSTQVTEACKKYGGFYLGSIGGPAALLAENNITEVTCIDYPELGMEAVWKITVTDFPAFILTDNKGNDFFSQLS
jgi:fumarate hydratase class I